MRLQPPAAEGKLNNEYGYAYHGTGRDAEIAVKAKAPVVEQHRTYHALADVVGKAHAAVGHYAP